MIKFILPVLALLGAAAPAIAADGPLSFERDGVHYVATVKTVGAATLISGSEVETGKHFELRYLNGRVAGQYGAATVRYTMPAATSAR